MFVEFEFIKKIVILYMKLHIPAIVYLSLALFILFIGVKKLSRNETMYEIMLIVFITFGINVLCMNELNNIAWYFVIFFVLIPIIMAIIALLPFMMSK